MNVLFYVYNEGFRFNNLDLSQLLLCRIFGFGTSMRKLSTFACVNAISSEGNGSFICRSFTITKRTVQTENHSNLSGKLLNGFQAYSGFSQLVGLQVARWGRAIW